MSLLENISLKEAKASKTILLVFLIGGKKNGLRKLKQEIRTEAKKQMPAEKKAG